MFSGIFLGAHKTTPEQLKQEIITMDECLNESYIDQLIQNIPPNDELQKLKKAAVDTPLDDLHDAEKFSLVVSLFRLLCIIFG